jgi:NAD(P)-dependent dehydrogenase (short-subunit alcohol dehydrogenase family)
MFKDKVVVITGAAQGIGSATAMKFASMGAKLALIDIKEDGLKNTKSSIEANNGVANSYKCDIASSKDVNSVFESIARDFGTIDVLVNNAGVLRRAYVEEADDAHWDFMISVNLLGPVYCSRAAIPLMKKNGGAIINCSSILGTFPNTGSAAYGVAKQGIILLTRVMSAELAPYGIRVNAYSPGVADTEFAADVIKNRGDQKLEQIALKRFGEPDDIAELIAFLASDQSSYVTGQTIAIDGGMWITQKPASRWKEV